MDRIHRSDLEALLLQRGGPCVSIYFPLHPEVEGGRGDRIRLKILADQAEDRLVQSGMRRPDAKELVQQIRDLPSDMAAWTARGRGMAIFAAPTLFRAFRLHGEVAEAVYIDERFHIRPILPLVTEGDRYYLLALSEKRVRFFQGNMHGLTEIPLSWLSPGEGHPEKLDEIPRSEKVTAAERKRGAILAGVIHGQGGGPETPEEDLLPFLREVASEVDRHLRGEQAPLILACVQGLAPLWRQVSTHKFLHGEILSGSPDRLTPHELHARAWPIVGPATVQQREALQKRLRAEDGSRARVGLKEILPAAMMGRVDALFIDCTRPLWGSLDENGTVEIHRDPQPGDADLVELAAAETLSHRGQVFAVHSDDPANRERAEALLRY